MSEVVLESDRSVGPADVSAVVAVQLVALHWRAADDAEPAIEFKHQIDIKFDYQFSRILGGCCWEKARVTREC